MVVERAGDVIPRVARSRVRRRRARSSSLPSTPGQDSNPRGTHLRDVPRAGLRCDAFDRRRRPDPDGGGATRTTRRRIRRGRRRCVGARGVFDARRRWWSASRTSSRATRWTFPGWRRDRFSGCTRKARCVRPRISSPSRRGFGTSPSIPTLRIRIATRIAPNPTFPRTGCTPPGETRGN